MKRIITFLSVFVLVLMVTSSSRKTTIFVIGDSTAAEKQWYKTSPERGWGMVLQGCFDDQIIVDNHAVNGRSSKSFYDNGRLDTILGEIKAGDYLMVQFGINDSAASNAERYAPVAGSRRALHRFPQWAHPSAPG